MPELKKPTYVTYKGTKIEPLNDYNIYSWLDDARNLLIIEDYWKYIDPEQADAFIKLAEQDDKDAQRQLAVAKAILNLLISHDTWQQYRDIDSVSAIWARIERQAVQLWAEKEALFLQQLETITFDEKKGMEDYFNRISRQVSQIKGVGGTISDVATSSYIIRGLPRTYDLYKPLINSVRADTEKVKLELLKAKAMLKEDSMKTRGNSQGDPTPKALAAQAAQQGGNNNNNNNNSGQKGGKNRGNTGRNSQGKPSPFQRFPVTPYDENAYCKIHDKVGHSTENWIQ